MKHGAVDLLTKPVDAKDLLTAVERALAKDLRTRVADARLASIQERVKTLTGRETQVFALVVTGMLNKQIPVVSQRDGDGAQAIPGDQLKRPRAAHDVRRAVTVARQGNFRGIDQPQRGLAREQLEAGFLGGEPGGETCRPARSFPGVAQLLARKILSRSSAGVRRSKRSTRAISTVSMPQRVRGLAMSAITGRRRAAARKTSAVLDPPKPRFRTSATSLRSAWGRADTGRLPTSGSDCAGSPRREPTPWRRAARASTLSRTPEAARGWPKAHLNAVTGGMASPNTGGWRALPTRPMPGWRSPCATIIPTSAGRSAASSSASAIASASPSPSARMGSSPSASDGAAAAEKLAEDRGVALAPRPLRLEKQRAAPSPSTLPLRRASKGHSPSALRSPSWMVVEDHLGLDRAHRARPPARDRPRRRAAPRPPRPTARDPLTLWFVRQAFGPFRPWRMPT